AGDTLVAGDWNGDGTTSVGVWRAGTFFLTQSTTRPATDAVVGYGAGSDRPAVGGWDGKRSDPLGVQRGYQSLLRNSNTGCRAHPAEATRRRGPECAAGRRRPSRPLSRP